MCGGGSCSSLTLNADRCVREIVILELRSIASEFLTEAKNLALPNWVPTSFGQNANIVPVEVAAADIFDYHLVNHNTTQCALTGTDTPNNVGLCIANATGTALPAQVDLSTISNAAINATSNLVKLMGLGLLNSYLHKLNLAELSYATLNDNLLVDLHGSQAEYAFNFGILSDILAQDSQTNSANATCHSQFSFTGANSVSFELWLNGYIPPASSRTLCTMLQNMSGTGGFTTTTWLHTHMFRLETATGIC